MAHKKGQGSTRNGRDSKPKMRGVKRFGGEVVSAGSIIVRQRGSKFSAGAHVGTGRDWTLFALKDGRVKYTSVGDKDHVYVFDRHGRKVIKKKGEEISLAL